METKTLLLSLAYLIFGLVIYISYASAFSHADYAGKTSKKTVLWVTFSVSLFTYIVSAALHSSGRSGYALSFMLISSFCDSIIGAHLGVDDTAGQYSKSLAYFSIAPIVIKTLLATFFSFGSNGYSNSKTLDKLVSKVDAKRSSYGGGLVSF